MNKLLLLSILILLVGCSQSSQSVTTIFQTEDERDWNAAKTADNADGYIKYLTTHKGGAFVNDARRTAAKFLQVKFTDMGGQALITDGWGKGDLEFVTSDGQRGYYVTSNREDGFGIYFDGSHDVRLNGGNVVLHPRIPCAKILQYRDKTKGVLLTGFDINLQGTSQSFAIFHPEHPIAPSGPIAGCQPGTGR